MRIKVDENLPVDVADCNHFSNIRAYPPDECCGIIVLRITNQSKPSVLNLLEKLLVLLRKESDMSKCLWIVEEGRVRVRW